MEIKNINNNATIEFLENDSNFLIKVSLDKREVYIGHPRKSDVHNEMYYPIYVDGQEIFGTGTTSIGLAIRWAEQSVKGWTRKNMSPLEDTVRCISREVSILESLILRK